MTINIAIRTKVDEDARVPPVTVSRILEALAAAIKIHGLAAMRHQRILNRDGHTVGRIRINRIPVQAPLP